VEGRTRPGVSGSVVLSGGAKRRSRRTSGVIVAVAFAALAAVAGARASVGPAEQSGVFALLGGKEEIGSKFWAEMGSGLSATLKVRQFLPGAPAPGSEPTPILDYDVDMQRLMHLIVIRDDFGTFAHLHPDFNTGTGTFSETFTKQPNHRYYVYADTMPHGIGQQVFRFTMGSDGPVAPIHVSMTPSAPAAVAGPYTVVLEKTTLAADTPQSLDLTVNRGGKPALDLGSYLGAPAHCVFINTSTLAYVHVHPMVRNGNSPNASGPMKMNVSGVGPLMRLHLPALPAGTYKLWIQFRGGAYKLYTVPFTIAAR
jgi:hypothetical protein